MSLMVTFSVQDFDFGSSGAGSDWQVINDGVMGGLSQGEFSLTRKSMAFSGTVSLDNNGGFSSLKGPFQQTDLSRYNEIEIRYKLEGHTMGLTLETSPRWYEPYYKLLLPVSENWNVLKFSLSDFDQYNVGRKTGTKITDKDLEQVVRVGFITSEKKAGNFSFEIDYLRFK